MAGTRRTRGTKTATKPYVARSESWTGTAWRPLHCMAHVRVGIIGPAPALHVAAGRSTPGGGGVGVPAGGLNYLVRRDVWSGRGRVERRTRACAAHGATARVCVCVPGRCFAILRLSFFFFSFLQSRLSVRHTRSAFFRLDDPLRQLA